MSDRFIDYANRYRPEWLCIDMWKKKQPDLGAKTRSGKLKVPGIGWVLFENIKELCLLLDCSLEQGRKFISEGKTPEGYEIHLFQIQRSKNETNLTDSNDFAVDYL